ncbi:MAG TPA: hypothetical protein EYP91_09630, partial [Gammaproteobacteria bacterium]|nr:hypothetical protein [Gammaproteobacteria bacterium]
MAKLHLPFGDDVMFAGPANSANALVEVGKVTLAIGKVTVKRMGADGQIEELDVKRGDKLYKGDELVTEGGAFVKARMLDGTRFHLGKNANAILSDYSFDETAKTGNFEAYVIRGGFHYKSGKIGKMFAGLNKNHSTISTPSATIGIRGSELDGNVDPFGNTTVLHKFGYLTVTDINGENPVVLDTTGNTSIITFNGVPAKFEVATPEQIQTLNQNLPPPDTPEELLDTDDTQDDDAGDDEAGASAADEAPADDDVAVEEAEGEGEGEGEADGEEDAGDEGEEDDSESDDADSAEDVEDAESDVAEGDTGEGGEAEDVAADAAAEDTADDAPDADREETTADGGEADGDPGSTGDNAAAGDAQDQPEAESTEGLAEVRAEEGPAEAVSDTTSVIEISRTTSGFDTNAEQAAATAETAAADATAAAQQAAAQQAAAQQAAQQAAAEAATTAEAAA